MEEMGIGWGMCCCKEGGGGAPWPAYALVSTLPLQHQPLRGPRSARKPKTFGNLATTTDQEGIARSSHSFEKVVYKCTSGSRVVSSFDGTPGMGASDGKAGPSLPLPILVSQMLRLAGRPGSEKLYSRQFLFSRVVKKSEQRNAGARIGGPF